MLPLVSYSFELAPIRLRPTGYAEMGLANNTTHKKLVHARKSTFQLVEDSKGQGCWHTGCIDIEGAFCRRCVLPIFFLESRARNC